MKKMMIVMALILSACGGGADVSPPTEQKTWSAIPSTWGWCDLPASYVVPGNLHPAPALLPKIFQPYTLAKGQINVQWDACEIPSVIIWSLGQYRQSPTTIAQWGTGAYDRGEWITAIRAANWLLAHQSPNGGFPLDFNHTNSPNDLTHGYHLKAPWYSSVTQGNAIGLLIHVWTLTGDPAYEKAALHGMDILNTPMAQGGLQSTLNGQVWFEETPDPNYPNHILNGSIFALLAIHDLYLYTGSSDALQLWAAGEASLRANLDQFIVWAPLKVSGLPDPWMIYDFQVDGFPVIPNYVTSLYGNVQINQMYDLYERTGNDFYKVRADSISKSMIEYMKNHAD